MNFVWVFLIGYLLGGIPFSVVVSKLFRNDDIRRHGSGNPGSSNMARTYGAGMGAIVLVLDVLKGVFASLIGIWLLGGAGAYYGGMMAVVGHNWPVYLKFKGGKGVAAGFGMVCVILGWWAIGAAAIFVIVFLISRYASLGSLCGAIYVWIFAVVLHTGDIAMVMSMTVLTVMIFWQHRGNIDRLLKGTESKFKF